MSLIYYVADPPQWARLRTVIAYNTQYEVGDRIATRTGTFGRVRVYRCTTAGTSDSNYLSQLTTDGQASFTWGTSAWTLITPDSWANASPVPVTWISGNTESIINYIDYTTENNSDIASLERQYVDLAAQSRAVKVFVNPATMLPQSSARRYNALNGSFSAQPLGADLTFFGHTSGGYYCRSPLNLVFTSSTSASTNATFSFVDSDISYYPVADSFSNAASIYSCFGVTIRYNGAINANGASLFAPNITIYNRAYGVTQLPYTPGATIEIATRGNYNSGIFGFHSPAVPTNKTAYETAGLVVSIARNHMISGWTSNRYESFSGTTTRQAAIEGHACSFFESSDCYRAAGFASWETPYSLRLAWAQSPDVSPDMSRPVFAPTIVVQNALSGARTVTLRFYTDCPIPLTNLDVWFDLFYGSSATTFVYSNATSMNANYGAPFATGTALTTTTGWTEVANVFQGTGYQIQLAVTINKPSPLILRFAVASDKFFYTAQNNGSPGFRLYVDPNVEVT